MADHRPNQHQTVMAIGAALQTQQYVRDRDLVAGHVGRYVIGWAQLDARLNMVAAHWTGTSGSDPQYNKMGTNKTHIKVDKLADRFDPGWRDGAALIAMLRTVNQYRNKLVHWGFGYSGQSEAGPLGWHLHNPEKKFLAQVLPLTPESMRVEEARLQAAGFALLDLISETFWNGELIELSSDELNEHSIGRAIIGQPGTWDTLADFQAFAAMVWATFPDATDGQE